jgi:hypothetical protein
MIRPDFLIIGAARTGTSWLRNALATIDRVFVLYPEQTYLKRSASNEIDAALQQAYEDNPQWDGREPAEFALCPQPIVGEKSPQHLSAPIENIRRLGELIPDARIIVGVREPVSRMLSHLVNSGIDYSQPVDQAVMDRLMVHGRYKQGLRHWATAFRPEQFTFYRFEDLRERPQQVFGEIAAAIGVENPPALSEAALTFRSRRPQPHPDRPACPDVLAYLRERVGGDVHDIGELQRAMAQSRAAAQAV